MLNDQQHPTDQLPPSLGTDAGKAKDNIAQLTSQMEAEVFELPGDDFSATREEFAGLYQSLREAGQKPEDNGALHPPGHPKVDLMPNGDVFGSYDDLNAYLKAQELSTRRGAEIMGFEAHHLIEDHWLKCFGFSSGEAPCVAIYQNEHMQLVHGEDGIPFELPSIVKSEQGETVPGVLYDIDTLVEGHTKVYQEIGRPEWADRLRNYVRDNQERIMEAYENGTVPGATSEDSARVRRYLRSL